MEQQKNGFEDPETRLRNFKEEILRAVEVEREHKKTAHFPEFMDVEELMPEDMEIWEKIKDETITMEEIIRYKKGLIDEEGEVRNNVSPSRIKFLAFASNKSGSIIMMRGMR